MKTLFLFLAAIASLAAFSQNQPIITGTETFGQWDTTAAGYLPKYWDGFNREVIINGYPVGTITTVYPDSSDPKDMDYSVRMVSSPVMGGAAVPGMLTTGKLHIDFNAQNGTIDGGVPYTARPQRLTGWYKYSPAAGDSALITVWFKKDSLKIGGGTLVIGQPAASWTPFTVNISFDNNDRPDTMNILFSTSSGKNNVPAGSVLEIDHIRFQGGDVGFTTMPQKTASLSVYPNPATSSITYKAKNESRVNSLTINDITGKIVRSYAQPCPVILDVESLQPGIYFLRLQSDKGISTAKFIKQ